jgi:hypothetical protein
MTTLRFIQVSVSGNIAWLTTGGKHFCQQDYPGAVLGLRRTVGGLLQIVSEGNQTMTRQEKGVSGVNPGGQCFRQLLAAGGRIFHQRDLPEDSV